MIEEMGLGEIIQALSLNRHKGTLRIEGEEGISKFFYLSDGEIVLIRTVKSEPVRIGELLMRAGRIDQEQLEAALELQKESRQRLGDALIALGHVTSADVDQVVRGKFEEEFLDIFLLDRGTFEFIFGLSPESLFSPDEKLEKISLNTSSLMLEAMRRVDDWQGMLKELGSLDEIYKNRVEDLAPQVEDYSLEGVSLAPALRRDVYELIDGQRTIREVLAAAQSSGASRLGVFHYIHALKKNDLVRPLEVNFCLDSAKAALENDDAAGTAKFLRAVMAKEKVEISLVRRYIEFLRRSSKPTLARRECKVLAAQYLVGGDVEHAIALYDQALEIDPRDTEVLDRLFYAHLRKSDVKKAIDVGFLFRDYMQRDSDLPIVARVVKNMRELEPDDSRVLEISGLLLKRQERSDEARRELEKALAAAKRERAPLERQSAVMQVLLEMDPSQAGLAKERAAVERDLILAAANKAARKRVTVLLCAGAAIALALLGYGEVTARSELSQAQKLALEAKDTAGRIQALTFFEKAAARFSTVHGTATSGATALRLSIDDDLARVQSATNDTIREKNKKEEEEKKIRDAAAREKALTAQLANIDDARFRQDWGQVVKLTLAALDASPADPRVKLLKVPVQVATTPPGAHASVEGGTEARTPCILEAPPRADVKLRLSKAGFTRIETTVKTDAFHPVDLTLKRGAAWRQDLAQKIVGTLAVGPDRVVAVGQDGKITALAVEDGARLWVQQAPRPEAPDALGDPAPPCIAQGTCLVGGKNGLLLGLELQKGEEKWRLKGSGAIIHAPLSVEVEGRERALVTRGATFVVIDAQTGTVEHEVTLPSAASSAPAARAGRAVAVLVDGRVSAVDLALGKVIWTVDAKIDAAGAPVIAPELGFVVAASREGTVVALSLADGATIYRAAPGLGTLEGGVAVDEGRIYIGTSKNRIAALDATDGRTLWDQLLGTTLAAPPRRFATSLYAALRTGDLVELAPGDGKRRSVTQTDGVPTASPVLCGTRLLLASGTAISSFERPEDE
jgi:outer membrane protein assembly factor BamB/tetratricopeptide (TPR) repeat protein